MVARPDTPPTSCNWFAAVQDWSLLLNGGDGGIGDCVPAAMLHCVAQRRAYAKRPISPIDDDAIRLYRQVGGYDPADPATDRGTVISAAMAFWASTGISIGAEPPDRLTAYATVNHVSPTWIKAAIWRCGSVLLGMQCPEAWLTADYLLDLPGGLGAVAGGHGALLVGYEETASGVEYDCITWGGRFRITERAILLVADEAYAPLDQDWMDADGLNPAGVDWAAAEVAMAAIRSA